MAFTGKASYGQSWPEDVSDLIGTISPYEITPEEKKEIEQQEAKDGNKNKM